MDILHNVSFYNWQTDKHGNPVRKRLVDADFSSMPIIWVSECLKRVSRYNGIIEAPKLDQHQVMVATLVKELGGDERSIGRALIHDVAELFVGDVISDLKQAVPDLRPLLKSVEAYILKQWAPDIDWSSEDNLVTLCDRAIRDTERGFSDKEDTDCFEALRKLRAVYGETQLGRALLVAKESQDKEWSTMIYEYFAEVV